MFSGLNLPRFFSSLAQLKGLQRASSLRETWVPCASRYPAHSTRFNLNPVLCKEMRWAENAVITILCNTWNYNVYSSWKSCPVYVSHPLWSSYSKKTSNPTIFSLINNVFPLPAFLRPDVLRPNIVAERYLTEHCQNGKFPSSITQLTWIFIFFASFKEG